MVSAILRDVERTLAHEPYIEIVNDWTSEELFAAASAVKELADCPGWVVIAGLLDKVRNKQIDQLTFSHTVDPAAVSRLRGQAAGLKGAEVAGEAVLLAAELVEQNLQHELARQTAETNGGRK